MLKRAEQTDDFQNVRWQELLCGTNLSRLPPTLNMRSTEYQFLRKALGNQRQTLIIQRIWDVDSFIARATTLDVHKSGFELCYRPSFFAGITSNPHRSFHATQIHKVRNIRLGQGLITAGLGFQCHVVFPKMATTNTVHLNETCLKRWLDEILIPSVRAVCPIDVLHHHPRSFADVYTKSEVRKEVHPKTAQTYMELRYTIAKPYLKRLWNEILAHAAIIPEFRDLFLIVSAHDLKLKTKKTNPVTARQSFLSQLHSIFDWTDRHFPPEDCWLDFGFEDLATFSHLVPSNITLLRKSRCLEHWASQFRCPYKPPSIRTDRYLWALTRDSGSIQVALSTKNLFHQHGLIAHCKAYNVWKDLFATTIKNHLPFSHPQFEGLAYSQAQMSKWYETAHAGGKHRQHTRHGLLKSFEKTKSRLKAAFVSSWTTDYGARQEYRMNITLFKALDLSGDNYEVQYTLKDFRALNPSRHFPYWVVPTSSAGQFFASQLNRFLYLAEVLAAFTQPGFHGLPRASPSEQACNGVMMSAMIRSMKLSFGGLCPEQLPELWLESWIPKRQRRGFIDEDDPEAAAPPTRRMGLNYQAAVEKHGLTWIRDDVIGWSTPPRFTQRALKKLALIGNAFQRTFRAPHDLRTRILRSDHIDEEFQELLRDCAAHPANTNEFRKAMDRVLNTGAELIVQSYVQAVFNMLFDRAKNEGPNRHLALPIRQEAFFAPLTSSEKAGLAGLNLEMMQRLLGHEPAIVAPRPNREGKGPLSLAKYNRSDWGTKLQGLFALDDDPVDPRGQTRVLRVWHNAPFRKLAGKLQALVLNHHGFTWESEFQQRLVQVAQRKLLIIFHYDLDKWSTMTKVHPRNTLDTKNYVNSLTALQRTQFIIPTLSPSLRDIILRADYGLKRAFYPLAMTTRLFRDADEDTPWTKTCKSAVKTVCRSVKTQLEVFCGHNPNMAVLPPLIAEYGLDPILHHATKFHEQVDKRIKELSHELESDASDEGLLVGQVEH